MPARKFTDAWLRNLKRPDPTKGKRQITYIDTLDRGCALVLVASYGGTFTWRVMTYVNGRAVTKKLGKYPDLPLKKAKDQARAYFEDPGRYARAEVGSFEQVAESWFKHHVQEIKSCGRPERSSAS